MRSTFSADARSRDVGSHRRRTGVVFTETLLFCLDVRTLPLTNTYTNSSSSVLGRTVGKRSLASRRSIVGLKESAESTLSWIQALRFIRAAVCVVSIGLFRAKCVCRRNHVRGSTELNGTKKRPYRTMRMSSRFLLEFL